MEKRQGTLGLAPMQNQLKRKKMETFCYKNLSVKGFFAAELRQKRGREKVIVRHHGLLSPTPAGILGSEVSVPWRLFFFYC